MKVFTVSQINKIIKDLIDNEVILEDIMITGELSSFSITRNIAYFTLKDNDNLLNCIQFNARAEYKIGDMVQCRGNVKYYPKGGKLTFTVLSIEACGQGELYQQFLKMKQKLQDEGLFDEDHKIPIPKFINSVGVVTSKTGAVLQDIKNIAFRRNPNIDIYVYDAQVQGNFAVQQVIEGISYFDNLSDVDVIIVARGGGSIEDLMPFNSEELARIAYICNKPIISAVGHETDFSILDFVADLRAPTPSAAAELITYDNLEIIQYIKDLQSNLNSILENKIIDIDSNINYNILNIERLINESINGEMIYINDIMNDIEHYLDKNIDNTTYRVNILLNTLDKLNPMKLLRSGYAHIMKDNQVINYKNINVGDVLDIRTSGMKLKAKVTNKEKL